MSGSFLMLIGILNLLVLVGIVRVFLRMRQGEFDEQQLEAQLNTRGFMNRFLGRATRAVRKSWHMYPLGLLFGLGFDTATEIALLATAGTAAAGGLPFTAILCLPILFAAGMSLLDTIDGAFMNFAYGWAFSKPVRKVFYNITITALSVAVALIVGSIELLAVFADQPPPDRRRLGLRLGPRPQRRRLLHRRPVRRDVGAGARGLALRPHRGSLDRAARAGDRERERRLGVVPRSVVHPGLPGCLLLRSASEREARMNLHRNARLTPRGRRLLVERVCDQQMLLRAAAEAAGVSTRTACKWVARYRREGAAGLEDRSSTAHRVPGRTSEDRVAAIAALRRLRMTAAEISETLQMPLSTVSGLSRPCCCASGSASAAGVGGPGLSDSLCTHGAEKGASCPIGSLRCRRSRMS